METFRNVIPIRLFVMLRCAMLRSLLEILCIYRQLFSHKGGMLMFQHQ